MFYALICLNASVVSIDGKIMIGKATSIPTNIAAKIYLRRKFSVSKPVYCSIICNFKLSSVSYDICTHPIHPLNAVEYSKIFSVYSNFLIQVVNVILGCLVSVVVEQSS